MLRHIVLTPHERAVVLRYGQPVRWLEPGPHWLWGGGLTVQRISLDEGYVDHSPELEAIIPPEQVSPLHVPADHRAALLLDGVPRALLAPGRYLLWRARVRAEAVLLDTRSAEDIPLRCAELIPVEQRHRVLVDEGALGLLTQRGKLVRLLTPGEHHLWNLDGGLRVRTISLDAGYIEHSPELAALVPPELVEALHVPTHHRAVLSLDGVPRTLLAPGRYLLWRTRTQIEATLLDTRSTEDIPVRCVDVIPAGQRRLVQIEESTRGLLTQHGKLVRLLTPGEHHLWNLDGGTRIEISALQIEAATPALEALAGPADADVVEIASGDIGLYRIDGVPKGALLPGRYLLWKHRHRYTVSVYSVRERFVEAPAEVWDTLAGELVFPLVVEPYEQALLYVDGALERVLETGRYLVSRFGAQVRTVQVDMREQQLVITGQEVMSADKVSLRINITLAYRVVDARRSVESTRVLHDSLYTAVQLAARRFVAGVTVDALLESRLEARAAMEADLAPHAEGWGVQIASLDLKDVILPGEMKAIFNQVIEAEKRAAANVITRREETAATRSLANTARMLESNPTLMRLKELESLKEIAEKVGEVTVVAAPEQLLGRLSLQK